MRTMMMLLLLAVAAPAPEIRYFRFLRPVQPTPAAGQTCMAIDPAVFAHAAPQLADLRLYTGTSETPYALRMAVPPTVPEHSIVPLNLGQSGGATVFDAAMPTGSYSDVELSVNAHDFIASVNVSGSQQQGAGPQTHVGTFTIFDLSKQKLGRSTLMHLPQSDFRFLHFRIDGPLAPEDLTGIVVKQARYADPKYERVAESSHATQTGHTTVFEFDVPARTPVDRVVFVPGTQPPNFSRDVTISVQSTKAPATASEETPQPTETAAGTLLRIHRVEDGRRIDEELLTVQTPPFDRDDPTRWTVKVQNGDDRPIDWQSVRLEMVQRNLCFDAAAGAAYTLYYGDPATAAPEYDYARLFASQPGAATARLDSERPNPEFQARPDSRPFTERHPALLWIALGAVLALLGVVALRSAKRTLPANE